MFSPLGAIGVSLLLQLAIAAFYDVRRAAGMSGQMTTLPGFLTYPDFYLFHVAGAHGNFSAMDFYPPNKEVFVPVRGDLLLASINDRAITRLLLEDRPQAEAPLEASGVDSAARRIKSTFAFSRTGRTAAADVRVSSTDDAAEANVREVLDPHLTLQAYAGQGDPRITEAMGLVSARIAEVASDTRLAVASERLGLREDGAVGETYRRIGLDEAMRIIAHG